MKNITLSIDDELYHRARQKAAEQKTSLSKLVAEYLRRVVEEDVLKEEARAQMKVLFERGTGYQMGEKRSREDLHEG